MIRLYLDNKEAVLQEDFELTLHLQNDFLNDRSEDSTYPFPLSVSANRHILAFPERLANKIDKNSFSARLMAGPYCLLSGVAYIESIEGDQLEMYMTSGSKTFWKQAKAMQFRFNSFSRLNDWTEEEARASLEKNFSGVFSPLYDMVNNGLINEYDSIRNLMTFDSRPFPRIRHMLYYYIEDKIGYRIVRNDLDNISWFKDLLLIYTGAYTFTKEFPLPDITFCDLVEELERRFAVRFLANDVKHSVSIIKFNDILKETGRSFSAYIDPVQAFAKEEDYDKTYIFQDKKTDDTTVNNTDSFIQIGYDTDNAETIECQSTQVGKWSVSYKNKRHSCAAVGEAVTKEGEWTSDYRIGIYKGLIDGYPVTNADELSWRKLYREFHVNMLQALCRKKTITFHVHSNDISVLKNSEELFSRQVIINHMVYLVISAEITLNTTGIIDFSLECTSL